VIEKQQKISFLVGLAHDFTIVIHCKHWPSRPWDASKEITVNVKNALHDKCTSSISFLKRMIAENELANANLHTRPESYLFNREVQRQHNLHMIESYKDEIIELEDLRDGHITANRLGTAGRFFNNMPAWATYGT
jgi:hypothetical protein